MNDLPLPNFVWELFQQLRRRQFPLGLEDYWAVRSAFRAGFGLRSRDALSELCCALWAKSREEKETVKALLQALFEKHEIDGWELPGSEASSHQVVRSDRELKQAASEGIDGTTSQRERQQTGQLKSTTPLEVKHVGEARHGIPPISLEGLELPQSHFVFLPQYPLSYRQIAQAWRRLRQPVRQGPPVELDIRATIRRRVRAGVATQVVMRPRRVNAARLLLLVDRQGSMVPFHGYVDEVTSAILGSATLKRVELYYFHDTPVHGSDETVLLPLEDEMFPSLDSVLPNIAPNTEGYFYCDPAFQRAAEIDKVLADVLGSGGLGATVAIISDAGAARRKRDLLRLLDTVSFLKALKRHTSRVVWLNPLPADLWSGTLASQIARHVPMVPLDHYGIYRAVDILRGHPFKLERPL